MKLTEINTALFTNVVATDYGFRFQHFNRELFQSDKAPPERMIEYNIFIHVLDTGGINVNTMRHVHITSEQLEEIMRVSGIIIGEK